MRKLVTKQSITLTKPVSSMMFNEVFNKNIDAKLRDKRISQNTLFNTNNITILTYTIQHTHYTPK